MWATDDTLLRQNESTGAMWGMTEDKNPRKARKGERAYYEFIHTLISSKKSYPVKYLFLETGDGTSFNELLEDKLDVPGLLEAFSQAGRYKNVKEGDDWVQIEQPKENWKATIDVLLTVTQKDGKYTQTCFPDKFIRTGYTAGITKMEEQNAKRPFIINKPDSPRVVHYTIQPQDFTDIPF